MHHRWVVLFLLLYVANTSRVYAADYRRMVVDPTAHNVIIAMNGEIAVGHTTRLSQLLLSLPAEDRLLGIAVDSPGGVLLEAEDLAGLIQKSGSAVAVLDGSTCASACFLLFAAAEKKFFGRDSYIGVHSVSHGNGQEDTMDLAFTTAFARDLGGLNVSPSIIGKLVTTRPGQMTWLTANELVSMGATYLPPHRTVRPPESRHYLPRPQPFVLDRLRFDRHPVPHLPCGLRAPILARTPIF